MSGEGARQLFRTLIEEHLVHYERTKQLKGARAGGLIAISIAILMSGSWALGYGETPAAKANRQEPQGDREKPQARQEQPQAQAPVADRDAQIVTATAEKPRTRAQLTEDAWELLSGAVNDEKHTEIRIQGLAALGTMGSNARSTRMIVDEFADKDVDVRTAAVLAAGQTRDKRLAPPLRRMLEDKEPQVVFTAASTLWKMGDHAGEAVLLAVVNGERKASAGLVHGSMHQANEEMHDPAALAKLGAMEGASMLLGPFGFGITAYEYVKKNGGDSARVSAVEEIAQSRTPVVRKTLQEALADKDAAVRTAAAKAMRSYHDQDAAQALALLFTDPKKPVQLSGAAAYLISVGAVATPAPTPLLP